MNEPDYTDCLVAQINACARWCPYWAWKSTLLGMVFTGGRN